MSERTVFTGARIISGEDVTESAAIAVRDGVIEGIGEIQPDPSSDVEVSLAGTTVLPAIVNPHGHIGYMRDTATDAAFYSRENVIDHLHRMAYYGISTFQSLGTDRDDTEIAVRDAQRTRSLGERDVAELLTAGAGIVAPTPGSINGGPFFAADVVYEATTVDGARAHVRKLAAKKVDSVKVWLDDRGGTKATLPPEIVEAVIEEAHLHSLPVAAHIYTLEEAKFVVRAGADAIAHLPRTGTDDELIALLIERGTAVFTSMAIQRPPGVQWLDEPEITDILRPSAVATLRASISERAPEPLYDTLEVFTGMERTLMTLADAGVRLVFSADAGLLSQLIGVAEHRELEALVAAGLSPLQVIRMATEASSEFLGFSDRGTLRTGARADFIILNEDPRNDITATRRIADVYLAGERIDRAALRAQWRHNAGF